MIHIDGDDFYRDGAKVGYISGKTIYDRDGIEVGYYEDDRVYNQHADKLAYIEDGYLFADSDRKIELDYVNQNVTGESLPEIARCAIYLLIGV